MGRGLATRTSVLAAALVALALAAGCGSGGGDACSSACGKLAGCKLCVLDQLGQCLSESDCTKGCRDGKQQAAAKCVNGVKGCDETAIGVCMQGGGTGGGLTESEGDPEESY